VGKNGDRRPINGSIFPSEGKRGKRESVRGRSPPQSRHESGKNRKDFLERDEVEDFEKRRKRIRQVPEKVV